MELIGLILESHENNIIGPARGKLLTSGQEHGDLIGQISRS
jgi:hypothetical protein